MKFTPGTDSRRNRAGRPPSARTLAALIRRELGHDASGIIRQVKMLAAAGDPAGVVAAALLLGAATAQKGPQTGQDSEVIG